jgi:hypothetical protein
MQPMNGNSRWTILSLAALVMVIAGALALAAGPPAGYHPVPFPKSDQATMPLKGHNGDGTGGYCVSIIGREDLGTIDVVGHVLDPIVRHRLNQQNARTIGWVQLSTDPGIITQEYLASAQNAFKLLALQSGDPALIDAADVPLTISELQTPQLEGARQKPPTTTCMKSSCYGQAPGCRVTGCSGGCADCVGIRVPSIQ